MTNSMNSTVIFFGTIVCFVVSSPDVDLPLQHQPHPLRLWFHA